MTHYERLKRRLAGRFLVANALTGEIVLVDWPTADRMIAADAAERPFPTIAVLDMAKALDGFAETPAIGKGDREFKLVEIAEIAGVNYHLAYNYCRRGIFTPSIRDFGGNGKGVAEARFSWADAFLAGTVGVLRRNRIGPDHLLKVKALLAEPSENQKKRTSRKVAASGRS